MTQDIELGKKQPVKWYFKISSLIIAFLLVGPLALPLVWLNPNLSKKKKIAITLIVIFVSYLLGVLVNNSLKSIREYYKLVL